MGGCRLRRGRTVLVVAALGASLAGCEGATPSGKAGQVGGPRAVAQASQDGRLDTSVLLAIANAVPRDLAGDVLTTVVSDKIAKTFQVDTFTGSPGVYEGYAPGFDAAVILRSRFLRRGAVLIPYVAIDSHFLPAATSSEGATKMIFYPTLVERAGVLVPMYAASPPPLLATYGVVYPVVVGATYVSPLDPNRVPPAALERPYINLRTPATTSISTSGGGTTTTTTGTSGTGGATSVTGTTTATGTTGPASTVTSTTGRSPTTTSITGPAITTTSTTGRSTSSSVSTGPATTSTTSTTGPGLLLRVIPGPVQRDER